VVTIKSAHGVEAQTFLGCHILSSSKLREEEEEEEESPHVLAAGACLCAGGVWARAATEKAVFLLLPSVGLVLLTWIISESSGPRLLVRGLVLPWNP